MSQIAELEIPVWTLGWRMQRSLAHAGMTSEQIAENIGVSRQTVSRWLNDRGSVPRIGYLRLWAIECNVPLQWLIDGETPTISELRIVAV